MRTQIQLNKHFERVLNCSLTSSYCFSFPNPDQVQFILCPHRCNSYFCKDCARNKRRKLVKKIKKGIEKKNLRFLTLTLKPTNLSKSKEIDFINSSFRSLVKRLKRKKYKFSYWKVLEFTKIGTAHLHVLIDSYIHEDVIRKHWLELTGAFEVKIKKPISHDHICNYIVKYMTKTSDSNNNEIYYLNEKRRYSFSKNFLSKFIPEFSFFASFVRYINGTDQTEQLINSLLLNFGIDYSGLLVPFEYPKLTN